MLIRDYSAEEDKKAKVSTITALERARATAAETALDNKAGTLSSLTTTDKTDIVSAINEVDSHADTNATNIGTLSGLTTTDKTDLVSAINEVDGKADTNASNIGTLSSLTTTATADLVSAINEVDSHADTNASDLSTIIGNDTGKSMREVAQEVSATVYTPQGSCTFANLPSLSASSTKVGFVYDVIDAFTTTGDFKEGAGIEVPAGTNIVVADVSGTKMWDLLGFNIDLSPYQKKVMTSAVSVGGVSQNTVEEAIGALANLPSEAVFHVATLPTGSSIQNVIYHNTTDGKYYVGNKTAQTVVELDTTVIEYVQELPSSGIEDKLYCVDTTRPHEEELVGFDILTNKNDDVLFKWWTDESHGTQRAMKFPVDLYQNNELLASISEINPSYGYSTDIYFDYDTSNPNTIGIVHYNNSSNQRIDANTKLVFHDVVRSGEKKLYYGDAAHQTLTKVGGNDIFIGTQAKWDALTTAEKNEYSQANITDSNSVVHVPVDVIADGNMNPVTSNAVYDALTPVQLSTLLTVSGISSSTHTVSGSGTVSGFAVKFGDKYFVQGKISLTNAIGATIESGAQCKVTLTTTGLVFDVEPIIRVRGNAIVGIIEMYANNLNDFWFRNFDGTNFNWTGTNPIVVQFCGWAHKTN